MGEYVGIVFLIVLLCIPILGFKGEKKLWNNGICPETGKPWERFDTDSQGGRGYVSEGHYIWMSYPWIDPHKGKKAKQF